MEVNRPQQASQSSRKGKKAWRKNVNIDDISQGLQDKRERLIALGDSEINGDDDFFIIDNDGDEKIKNNLNKEGKKLKSHEILVNKSKVKPLAIERNNKAPVSKYKVNKLMKLAGRVQGESGLKARVEKDGIVKGGNVDPWATEEAPTPQPASHEITKPSHAPKTIRRAPISLGKEEDIDAGKSYNPSLESWKSLINKEFDLENEKEIKRQQIKEYQEKIQNLILNSTENEVDDSEDDQISEQEESDQQLEDYKLSLNKPTEVKIKTKAKRNKQIKHKKRVELEEKLKQLKAQLNDLNKLEEINNEAQQPVEYSYTGKDSKRTKKLFKYDSIQRPLEVKLSDELTNNLKNVKPEGNLFYDQMIELQQSGKIESRIPVAKKRKYAQKFTEKWSYKDFK